MFKKLFFIFCLILFHFFSKAQELKFNFEQWGEYYLYDEPEVFDSYNFQSFLTSFKPNVTKVPGIKGSAIRLENTKTLFDTSINLGLIILGDLVGFPKGGFPFNEIADSVSFYIRHDLKPEDTALIAFGTKRFSNLMTLDFFPFYGTLNQFTKVSFPLTKPLFSPDTILFVLTSGKFNGAKEGSWLEVDDIKFSSLSQVENSGFDNWQGISFSSPDEWSNSNFFSALLRTRPSVVKSSDAINGNSSMLVEAVYNSKLNLNSYFFTAGLGDPTTSNTSPYAYKANKMSFSFQYKYEPVGNDTAWLIFSGHKFNHLSHAREYVFSQSLPLTKSTNWTKISKDLGNLASETDSISLNVYATNIISNTLQEGSKLWIDDIRINEITANKNIDDDGKKIILSNLVYDQLSIKVTDDNLLINSVEIFSSTWNKMFSYNSTQNKQGIIYIPMKQIPSGHYFAVLNTNNGVQVKPFIKI